MKLFAKLIMLSFLQYHRFMMQMHMLTLCEFDFQKYKEFSSKVRCLDGTVQGDKPGCSLDRVGIM